VKFWRTVWDHSGEREPEPSYSSQAPFSTLGSAARIKAVGTPRWRWLRRVFSLAISARGWLIRRTIKEESYRAGASSGSERMNHSRCLGTATPAHHPKMPLRRPASGCMKLTEPPSAHSGPAEQLWPTNLDGSSRTPNHHVKLSCQSPPSTLGARSRRNRMANILFLAHVIIEFFHSHHEPFEH
jgi:hypothetical protein